MNKKMKKYVYLVSLLTLSILLTTQASAQVDSSFTYQGELQDSNSPANDTYDFLFNLTDSDGFPFGDPSEHLNTDVVNGLFSLNVDFNIDAYDGFGDVGFSIEVRESSVGGVYTLLGSQTIQSVPLATNLTNGDAMTGEVLTFNGFQWVPQTPVGIWEINGSNIGYTSGNVGVGTINPLQDFVVNGTTNGDVVRVNVDGNSKFLVDDNGGVGIGSLSIPPVNGLDVEGDVKQPLTSNGMIKYMVHAFCSNSGSSIAKSYNGVSNGAITISDHLQAGRCEITFPADISDRYFQVSPLFGVPGRAASCSVSLNELNCVRFNPSTLTGANGSIMILVY